MRGRLDDLLKCRDNQLRLLQLHMVTAVLRDHLPPPPRKRRERRVILAMLRFACRTGRARLLG